MVVARSARQARAAAKAVRLVYEEPGTARAAGELDVHHQHLRPVPTRVVSGLEEARRQGTIVDAEDAGAALKQLVAKGGHIRRGLREVLEDPEPLVLARGDPAGTIAVRKAEGGQGTISASVSTGAQKHFYMETQASVAIPMVCSWLLCDPGGFPQSRGLWEINC